MNFRRILNTEASIFTWLSHNPLPTRLLTGSIIWMWAAGFDRTQFIGRLASWVVVCCFVTTLYLKKPEDSAPFTLEKFMAPRIMSWCFAGFICLFSLYVIIDPLCRVFAGKQGIDFAIFSQVIDGLAKGTGPMTSLVRMEKINFFGHHFTPIFWVPALLSKLDIPSYISLALIQGLSYVIGFFFFYKSQTAAGFSNKLALCWTLLLASNPTIRQSAVWGVHDETLAVGFLGLAYYSWLKDRPTTLVFSLFMVAMCKETISLVAGLTLISLLIANHFKDKPANIGIRLRSTQLKLLSAAALFFIALAVGYAFFQPVFFHKSFDHFDKLAKLSELKQGLAIDGKIELLKFLFVPVLFIPMLRCRHWIFLLPAIPLLGMMLLSNFSQMWSLMNYYGVIPTYILYFGVILGAIYDTRIYALISKPGVILFLLFWNFSWSTERSIDQFRAIRESVYHPNQLSIIPSDSTVIATPTASLFLFRVENLWRLYHANRNVPEKFDFVVTTTHEIYPDEYQMGEKLTSRIQECFRDQQWIIYCERNSSKKLVN